MARMATLLCILIAMAVPSNGFLSSQVPVAVGMQANTRWFVGQLRRPAGKRESTMKTRMVLEGMDSQVDFDQVQQIVEMAEAAPSILISAYHSALATYPTGTDALTGMSLYFLGKSTSGAITKQPPGPVWLARWMICGLCDGACTHQWYLFLDSVLSEAGLEHWTQAAIMTLLSTAVYTPLYSAAFLAGLTLLEGKGVEAAQDRVRQDFRQLTTASVTMWAPINLMLFGAVESEMRVAVSECIMFVYLVALALWNEGFFALSSPADDAAGTRQTEMMQETAVPWVEEDFLGLRHDDDSDLSGSLPRSQQT